MTIPSSSSFTAHERRIINRLTSPAKVQNFLNQLNYNHELPPHGITLRSFRGVLRTDRAHCLEAVLTAAVILEQHNYPPLLMSFESADNLDHVIFLYRRAGRWGSIGRSRDPGLHGRRAVFTSPRALALSYVEPFVDLTGRITGYAVVDLRMLKGYNWRLTTTNVWKVERFLIDYPHQPIKSSDRRIDRLRRKYRKFRTRFPNRKPTDYRGRDRWSKLPAEFSRQEIFEK